MSVFLPTWGQPPAALLSLTTRRWPWLYINLLLTDSQLFVPVLTPHLGRNPLGGEDVVPLLYGHLRDMLMRQANLDVGCDLPSRNNTQPGLEQAGVAVTMGEFSTIYHNFRAAWLGAAGMGSGAHAQGETLNFSAGAFRLGYFCGGDMESVIKLDLRNTAAFVRDVRAAVTNIMQPLKV